MRYFLQVIFDAFMDIIFTVWYIALLLIAGLGGWIDHLGCFISNIGQWLESFDPLRF